MTSSDFRPVMTGTSFIPTSIIINPRQCKVLLLALRPSNLKKSPCMLQRLNCLFIVFTTDRHPNLRAAHVHSAGAWWAKCSGMHCLQCMLLTRHQLKTMNTTEVLLLCSQLFSCQKLIIYITWVCKTWTYQQCFRQPKKRMSIDGIRLMTLGPLQVRPTPAGPVRWRYWTPRY
jgi:hypothetical protein